MASDCRGRVVVRIAMVTGLLALTSACASTGSMSLQPWALSTPGAVGLNPDTLAAFDSDIAAGKYGYVDGLLVIRHGKVAFERTYAHDYDRIYGEQARSRDSSSLLDPSGPYNYYNPWWHPFYRRGGLHTLQSVSKAVTSIVIGVAVSRGEFPSIDTPVLSFFDSVAVAQVDDRKRRMTIRHLQTMTAGLDWDETGPADHVSRMEASFDWVGFVINRAMAHEPGAVYNYNSGATMLLSYVFRAATGIDIEEYAARHLFAPLGIKEWFWKRTPTGLADTEGGLYLAPRDVAKLGQLYLEEGKWGRQAVVSEEWVRATLAPSIQVPDRPGQAGVNGGFNVLLFPYGTERKHFAFVKSGHGGQLLIGLPELELVVVVTGWTIPRRIISPRTVIDRIVAAVER